jgi:hypothetical protein
MKETGKMIKRSEREFIFTILMGKNTMAIGKMEKEMAAEQCNHFKII